MIAVLALVVQGPKFNAPVDYTDKWYINGKRNA